MKTTVRYMIFDTGPLPGSNVLAVGSIDKIEKGGAHPFVQSVIGYFRIHEETPRAEVGMYDADDELLDCTVDGRRFVVAIDRKTPRVTVEEVVVEEVPDHIEDEDPL